MAQLILELAELLSSLAPALFSDVNDTKKYIRHQGNNIELKLPFVCDSALRNNDDYVSPIQSFVEQNDVSLNILYDIPSIKGQNPKSVKNILSVASGKGGVGKSTTAINIATALRLEGAKVGILDADIYGPSLPTLLGSKGAQPQSNDGRNMLPIEVHGIQTMSMGYLVDDDSAAIWRGPMASKAFQQMYNETLWHELDYLIVDMPPGTGDIQLTLSQNMPVTSALIVTTPQDLALADAIKGVAMFNEVDVPVLGIVENMSYHSCSQCGHKEAIFGEQGGMNIAKKYDTQLLAQLPLTMAIRQFADSGIPLMYEQQAHEETKVIYRQLAQSVSFKLSQLQPETQQIASVTVD